MTYPVTFFEFEHIAESLDHHEPSEVHGMLCGMLCADTKLDSDLWLEQIRAEGVEDDVAARDILLELYAATLSQLTDDSMGFRLLLPDEENSLSLRAESLGQWCEGFLSGLGLGGLDRDIALPEEIHEFLSDLTNIARIGFDTDAADNDDEEAYTEIVEYVRVGVMLFHQELRSRTLESTLPPRLH